MARDWRHRLALLAEVAEALATDIADGGAVELRGLWFRMTYPERLLDNAYRQETPAERADRLGKETKP